MNFKLADSINELIRQAMGLNITQGMKDFFDKRTKNHIDLTKKYCKRIHNRFGNRFEGIIERGEDHDQSKYKDPELEPYILVTWDYKCKDDGVTFDISDDVRELMNNATEHHVNNNRHHPEFHCKNKGKINRENRDEIPDEIIDATAMEDLDIAEMCLTGDTKISLLNGKETQIKDLVNEKEFWVYSCTTEGKIVPGKGHSVRKTKKNATVYRITLDNDLYVDCTDNHKFMMRDGTYKEVKDLVVGDSLMPLYRKDKDGYEQIYNLNVNKWKLTHRMMVDEYFGGYQYYTKKFGTNQLVCHHKNFMDENNKKNNDPSNLEIMTKENHYKIHSEKQKKVGSTVLKKLWENPAFRKKQKTRVGIIGKTTGPKNLTNYNKSKKHKKTASKNMIELNKKSKKCNYCGKIFGNVGALSNHIKSFHEVIPDWRQKQSNRNSEIWKNPKYKEKMRKTSIKNATTPIECSVCGKICGNSGGLGNHMKTHKNNTVNHKIISIKKQDIKKDVFDMTVDVHHNFAITSGIFLHNCTDWCAMSEEKGTNTPMEWADKNVNVRWKFNDDQIYLIYEILNEIWGE